MSGPELPPAVLASADQWLASSRESFALPLANVRKAMAAPDTEARLANVAIALAGQAVGDAHMCQGLAVAYVLCLYELARTQARLETLESRKPEPPWS